MPGEDSGATGIDGDELDSSAPDSGAAYVFTRAGNLWSQEAYLKADNSASGLGFGETLAMSGETLVVGALGEDSGAADSGAAYVFARSMGTLWSQQTMLKAAFPGTGDRYGGALAISTISGTRIAVGAREESSGAAGVALASAGNDDSRPSAGAVYVYVEAGPMTWNLEAYIKATNPNADDWFGDSLSLSGDILAVGARNEDSQARGADGDSEAQNNNNAGGAGAVYVYRRSTGSWVSHSYVKATHTEFRDDFGLSVALEGDQLFIGSPGDDSAATGVNGDASDNTRMDAGAVFLYQVR
jgi:hypothetical protein